MVISKQNVKLISPVQISRFLHNKKITCANLAVFAQQIFVLEQFPKWK